MTCLFVSSPLFFVATITFFFFVPSPVSVFPRNIPFRGDLPLVVGPPPSNLDRDCSLPELQSGREDRNPKFLPKTSPFHKNDLQQYFPFWPRLLLLCNARRSSRLVQEDNLLSDSLSECLSFCSASLTRLVDELFFRPPGKR